MLNKKKIIIFSINVIIGGSLFICFDKSRFDKVVSIIGSLQTPEKRAINMLKGIEENKDMCIKYSLRQIYRPMNYEETALCLLGGYKKTKLFKDEVFIELLEKLPQEKQEELLLKRDLTLASAIEEVEQKSKEMWDKKLK